jgi:protein-disulfide isomerase
MDTRLFRSFLFLFLVAAATVASTADTIDTPLTDQQWLHLRDSLLTKFTIPTCDSLPMREALTKAHVCPIAHRLIGFAEWLVSKGKNDSTILSDLKARYESLTSSKIFKIDLKDAQKAGDSKAPVAIVGYISASCPLCKFICNELHTEVTTGKLKGKATLSVKMFTQTPGDRALLAAAHYNKFWAFIESLNMRKVRADQPLLEKIADSLAIPLDGFKKIQISDSTLSTLIRYRDEGVRNEVSITPTFFINGKRYHSYKDPRWIIDAANFEIDK